LEGHLLFIETEVLRVLSQSLKAKAEIKQQLAAVLNSYFSSKGVVK
jgi:hypothetical protein